MNRLKAYELKRRVLAAFFPNICPFCQRVIRAGEYWCESCPEALPTIRAELSPPENISRLFACCWYGGLAREAVHLLKFRSVIDPADAFALMMSERIKPFLGEFDCIVPVPSGIKSIEKRGFSPADVIARRLSVYLGLPVINALGAVPDKAEQKRLSGGARLKNARRSFYFRKGADITGARALLADDVTTTGSTLSVLAEILLENGAESVSAAVFAKTVRYEEKRKPNKYKVKKSVPAKFGGQSRGNKNV